MSNANKAPKEFYIFKTLHANHKGRVSGYDNLENAQAIQKLQPNELLDIIHVIEKSAYKKLQNQLEKANKLLHDAKINYLLVDWPLASEKVKNYLDEFKND